MTLTTVRITGDFWREETSGLDFFFLFLDRFDFCEGKGLEGVREKANDFESMMDI